MNDKEKEIEEMARIIDDNHGFIVSSVETAEALYNAGYRNCKDKVVLSKEEYEAFLKVNSELAVLEKSIPTIKAEARQETAREILSQVKNKMKKVDGLIALNYAVAVINELAKQYGVEVENEQQKDN